MSDKELQVDRARCEGFGLCQETAPELVHLDEEGNLVIDRPEIPDSLEASARAAVGACPVMALRMTSKPAHDT